MYKKNGKTIRLDKISCGALCAQLKTFNNVTSSWRVVCSGGGACKKSDRLIFQKTSVEVVEVAMVLARPLVLQTRENDFDFFSGLDDPNNIRVGCAPLCLCVCVCVTTR